MRSAPWGPAQDATEIDWLALALVCEWVAETEAPSEDSREEDPETAAGPR